MRETPPLCLTDYAASPLRQRLSYAERLLTWAANWFAEVQDVDLDAAADALAHAKRLRRMAWGVEKALEEAVLAEMFHQSTPLHLGDGYSLVVRPGRDRKGWKHPEVMDALVDQTTERLAERFPYLPEGPLQAVVREAMWEVHKNGRVEWRSTDLRRSGLDPDEFSTNTEESPTVDLRGKTSYAKVKKRPRGLLARGK